MPGFDNRPAHVLCIATRKRHDPGTKEQPFATIQKGYDNETIADIAEVHVFDEELGKITAKTDRAEGTGVFSSVSISLSLLALGFCRFVAHLEIPSSVSIIPPSEGCFTHPGGDTVFPPIYPEPVVAHSVGNPNQERILS